MKETELRYLIAKEEFTGLIAFFKLSAHSHFEQVFFIEKPKKQLQLRTLDNKWQLRLKSRISSNTDIESEVTFAKEQLANILHFCHTLGYHKLFVISKNRFQTIYKGISIIIDHYLEPEMYVLELELCDNGSISKLQKLARQLDIEKFQIAEVMTLKKKLMKKSKLSFDLNNNADFKKLLKVLN